MSRHDREPEGLDPIQFSLQITPIFNMGELGSQIGKMESFTMCTKWTFSTGTRGDQMRPDGSMRDGS